VTGGAVGVLGNGGEQSAHRINQAISAAKPMPSPGQ
jgi:hypothetical protein